MAAHLLEERTPRTNSMSRRQSKLGMGSVIQMIPEDEEEPKQDFKPNQSPLTSRNESMLFAIPKDVGPNQPNGRSRSESTGETPRGDDVAPRIMIIEEGEDGEDGMGNGKDGGEYDAHDLDVFDALGMR